MLLSVAYSLTRFLAELCLVRTPVPFKNVDCPL